jgi:hypothetical protein
MSKTLRDVNTKDLSGTIDANIDYTHTFKKPQQEFSLLTQFSRNNRTNDFVNNLLNLTDNSVTSRLKNNNDSYNQEVTVQADYQTPITKSQLVEVGAKGIFRTVNSDYQYFTAQVQLVLMCQQQALRLHQTYLTILKILQLLTYHILLLYQNYIL